MDKARKAKEKNIEKEMHKQLYDLLVLLKHRFPTTTEFNAVVKQCMFVKNNKAAFREVIYYLLKVLNPSVIKQKIPTWPVFELKLEAKFRKEVMNYINELNMLYPDYDVPKIMASQLINPGGVKFLTLMLDIAHLVVAEVLTRNDTSNIPILEVQPKNSKQKISGTKHLAELTAALEGKISKTMEEHTLKSHKFKKEFEELSQQILQSKKIIKQSKQCLAAHVPPEYCATEADVEEIEKRLAEVKTCQSKFNKCISLLNYLKGDDCYLKADEPLNLLQHFSALEKKLSCVAIYNVRRVDENVVSNKTKDIERLNFLLEKAWQNGLRINREQQEFYEKLIGENRTVNRRSVLMQSSLIPNVTPSIQITCHD